MNIVRKLIKAYWARRLTLVRGEVLEPTLYVAPEHVKKAQRSRVEVDSGATWPASPFEVDMTGEYWGRDDCNELTRLYHTFGHDSDFLDRAAAWARRSTGAIEARLLKLELIQAHRTSSGRSWSDAVTDQPLLW